MYNATHTTYPVKLKRVVVKEEYIAITGDYSQSILLNQFIYWSERVKDFDKFIQEEYERQQMNNNQSKDCQFQSNNESTQLTHAMAHGWIYKKASDLKEECMFSDSEKTIARHIASLVEKGFIDRRRNPNAGYDRTYQYRVNFPSIIIALNNKGYTLQDYRVQLPVPSINPYGQNVSSKRQIDDSKGQNFPMDRQNDVWNGQNVAWKGQNVPPMDKNDYPKVENVGTIPEIISNITSEITSEITNHKITNHKITKKNTTTNDFEIADSQIADFDIDDYDFDSVYDHGSDEDKNNVVVDPFSSTLLNNNSLDNITEKINETIKSKISTKIVNDLMIHYGLNTIQYCLSNWHKFDQSKMSNPSGMFVDFVKNKDTYTIPTPVNTSKNASTKVTSTHRPNFEQRKYTDEFYRSLEKTADNC